MSKAPVRDPNTIAKLLGRLLGEKAGLHIWHPDCEQPHLSLLVGLKGRSGLYLDAPPDSVIDLYEKGTPLLIRSRLDGTELRFRTRLQVLSRYDGYPALLCEWPSEVHHFERRMAFRVRVSGPDAFVSLALEDEPRLRARLVDLSVTGFGALISRRARLSPGEVLDCALELRGQQLFTSADIQSFKEVPGTRFWRLGARFDQLDPSQERQLGKLVLEMERQAIQLSRRA